MVSSNGQYLGRLIQVRSFLGKQELVLCSDQSVNKGDYLEIFYLIAQEELFVNKNLEPIADFKGTSSDSHNVLSECVTLVTDETLAHIMSITNDHQILLLRE